MNKNITGKMGCSVREGLEVYRAGSAEYEHLSRYHYRSGALSPYAAVFAVRDRCARGCEFGRVIGVIVYTMPVPSLQLRNIATGGAFTSLGGRGATLAMINANVRCISRVIIEPRYRGLGIAAWLVRETMELMDVPIVESLAVMGRFSGFFEDAGMTRYDAPPNERCVRLIEAMSMVGVEEEMFIEPSRVHTVLSELDADEKVFMDLQIDRFLQAYGKRRFMAESIDRTRYVLSKLTFRPAYYIWFKESLEEESKATANTY